MSGLPEAARENCVETVDYFDGSCAELAARVNDLTAGVTDAVERHRERLDEDARKLARLVESVRDEPSHETIFEIDAMVVELFGSLESLAEELRDMGADGITNGPLGAVRETLYELNYMSDGLTGISRAVEEEQA